MREEYNQIIHQALSTGNPLVNVAAEHIAARTEQMRKDQVSLGKMLNAFEGVLDDMSGEALQRRVLNYVDSERKIFQEFDTERKSPGAARLPEQVSNHKMALILNRVHAEFADDESTVVNLFSKKFSPEDSFYATWPALRTDTYWGSTRGVMQSAKQICAHFAVSFASIKTYREQNLGSSILHSTPWTNLTPCFTYSESKFYSRVDGVPAFGFIHGGYAFGGQREENVHALFGPEDCSSILADWLHAAQNPQSTTCAPNQFSTLHQLYWWRSQQAGNFMIDNTVHTEEMQELNSSLYLRAYTPNEQQQAVKTGDVFLLRSFAKANGNPDSNAAGGGHTGVVLARDPDEPKNVLIFECARDMESENPQQNVWGPAGCGVGSFSAEYEQNCDPRIKRTMFLTPRF